MVQSINTDEGIERSIDTNEGIEGEEVIEWVRFLEAILLNVEVDNTTNGVGLIPLGLTNH